MHEIKKLQIFLRALAMVALVAVIAAYFFFNAHQPGFAGLAVAVFVYCVIRIKLVSSRLDTLENYEYTQRAYGRRMNRDAASRHG